MPWASHCIFMAYGCQIVYFGMIGGMTVKETVWRVLTKMLTNNFAKKVNWRGANGKQAFEPLALKGILLSKLLTLQLYLNTH